MSKVREIVTPDGLIPGVIELAGQNGNAFALIGAVRRALRRAGNTRAVLDAFAEDAMADDYDHLLRVCIAYTVTP